MDKKKPERGGAKFASKDLYADFSAAVLPVVVKDKNGDQGIGTAFHVGDGSFVTAGMWWRERSNAASNSILIGTIIRYDRRYTIRHSTVLVSSHCNHSFIQTVK